MARRLRKGELALLIPLVLLAATLRLYGLDWDGAIGAHPDERYLVGVAEGLCSTGRVNPYDVAPEFPYGHLPLYVLALFVRAGRGADPLLMGRILAALFDVGTVMLTFGLGRRVGGGSVGLLASALVALMVLHVQQAHYYTADVMAAFFVLGTLCCAVSLAENGRARRAWLGGVWAGLAVGCKASAVLISLPLAVACVVAPCGRRARWLRGLQGGAGALLGLMLTNPFAALMLPAFWRNIVTQAAIVRGLVDVPYTRQFHGTWPYVYSAMQQLRWGMGWLLGVMALCGLACGVWRGARGTARRGEWVLLAWILPSCAFVGGLYAKFPRYLLPVTPLLTLYAARFLLLDLLQRCRRRLVGQAWFCGGIVLLLCSVVRCLSFVSIYAVPHPWLVASDWFHAHVPPGTVVAVEAWDHPLPVDRGNGNTYDVRELPIFDEDDSAEKWDAMDTTLAEADHVIIASRRGYATLAGWPERYPRTTRYYRQLLAGELGYEPVACFTRYPRVGPLLLHDDPLAALRLSSPAVCAPEAGSRFLLGRLDESLVVYDQPTVIILRRAR